MEKQQISFLLNAKYMAAAASLQGLRHVSSDITMQDHHALISLPGDYMLAVVADGVGSEPYADKGSKMAADCFAQFVMDRWGWFMDSDSLLNLLKSACYYTTGEIQALADREGNSVNSYSTTLHAVIFAGSQLYYANAGDGGIIAFTEDGELLLVTEPMRDEEYVIPLLAGPDRWQFGIVEQQIKSVLLCTDGLFDKLAGSLLRKQESKMDRALAAWFVSPWAWNPEEDPSDQAITLGKVFRDMDDDTFYKRMALVLAQGQDISDSNKFVADHIRNGNRPLKTLREIGDDITAAVVCRRYGEPGIQPLSYYSPPDWDRIYQEAYNILYGPVDAVSLPDADG